MRLPTSWVWALLTAGSMQAMASGYFGPNEYLSDGAALKETPEFDWELEVKRMARDFRPTEKLALVPRTFRGYGELIDLTPMRAATETADAADYAGAIETGRIKPPDPAAARQQHGTAREAVQAAADATGPMPAEFDSEFADYDRGAFAFSRGKDHWDEACKDWEALLNRPAADRHYRSVWAAFMLGKVRMREGDPGAVTWFEKTRQLAASGFADSLGLAADSYGWEGRTEWQADHPAKAAPMFLNQLALGDLSAVVSLKALIPDRDDVDGMLNYTQPDAKESGTGTALEDAALRKRLANMAADPLLRRLETAHILATESGGQMWNSDGQEVPKSRSARWLEVVKAAGLEKVDDAEYLGWVAYTTGDYKDAEHWLELSNVTSPVAEWLRARLQLRAGQTKAANASMAAAWAGVLNPVTYTGWAHPDQADEEALYNYGHEDLGGLTMAEWASGDFGSMRLLRTNFAQALDAFLKGDLREDAAFVAERVLTANELKAYVDRMPPAPPTPAKPDPNVYYPITDATTWLRYLLGRRLVREERYEEAARYLPNGYQKLLAKYTEALRRGARTGLSNAERAAAYSTAAWIARNDGMELMGTEVAPDGFDSHGEFMNTDVSGMLLSGTFSDYVDGNSVTKSIAYPPPKPEMLRLHRDPVHPDVRYHYRIIAAALAMRAAALMPDNTEELADAVNHAGLWVMNTFDKLGDRYCDVIEKRCPNTKLGQEVIKKHWFVDETGPWSNALASQEDSLHKECGIQDPQ